MLLLLPNLVLLYWWCRIDAGAEGCDGGSKLLGNLLLCERSGVLFEESFAIRHRHGHLFAVDRDHAPCESRIVLHQEPNSDHQIVDVVEDLSMIASISLFRADRADRNLTSAPCAAYCSLPFKKAWG